MLSERFVGRWIRSLCATALLVTPLIFSPYWHRYRDLKSACFLWVSPLILASVAAAVIAFKPRPSTLWRLPQAVRLPLLLLAAWEIAGLSWALDLYLGFLRVLNDLLFFGLFGVLGALVGRRQNRGYFLSLLLGTGFLVSLFSLYQKAGGTAGLDRFYQPALLRQGMATFGNPNFLAHFLVGIIPLALGRLLFPRGKGGKARLVLTSITLVLCTQSLLFTGSRGGYLAAGTAILFLLAPSLKAKGVKRKVAGFLLVLLAGVVVVNSSWLQSLLSKKLSPEALSNRFRAQAYPDAIRMATAHPLGIGRGQTEGIFARFRQLPPGESSWRRASHIHSDPLEWAAELGLPGVLLGIWLSLALAGEIRRRMRQAPENRGGAAAALGLLVHSLFSFPLQNPTPSLVFTASLALALSSDRTDPPGKAPGMRSRFVPTVAIAFVLAAAVQVRLALMPLVASRLHREALTPATRNRAEELYKSAQKINPNDLDILYDAGVEHLKTGHSAEARQCFEQFTSRRPFNAKAWYNLGSAAWKTGNLPAAVRALERARSLHPQYPPTLNLLGKLYTEQGRIQEAETCFLETLRIQPGTARARYNLAAFYARTGRRQEALRQCREILQTDPEYQPARQLQDWILSADSLTSPEGPGTMRADYD